MDSHKSIFNNNSNSNMDNDNESNDDKNHNSNIDNHANDNTVGNVDEKEFNSRTLMMITAIAALSISSS